MTKKELLKRYVLLVIGLFLSALGVAAAKQGGLGVSPISSVANIVSIKLDFFTMGTWLIIWNCVLIVGQIIILRKDFKLIQLLQVPLSFVFGWFTDFGMWCVSAVPQDIYPVQLLMTVLGTLILAFGISLAVAANVIMNSGEAFVKAVSDKTHKSFGNVKVIFDISCVVLSVILSFIFFGELVGTREGTVIAAVCTGFAVKLFQKLVGKPVEKLLKEKS
ncbi:MAG: YitT family protein [Eubacterium sp.]|nr:YitT family protein [Eubacterium sp.]